MFELGNIDLVITETGSSIDPVERVAGLNSDDYSRLVREWTAKIRASAGKRLRAEIDSGGW